MTVFIAAARYLLSQKTPGLNFELLEIAFSSVGIGVLFGGIIGFWRWAWTIPAELGLSRWFPNLNGKWQGTVQSSFSKQVAATSYPIIVNIDQRWLRIRVEVRNSDGKRLSVSQSAQPRFTDEVPEIWIHFDGEGYTDADHPIDEQRYMGAARYRFDREQKKLTGNYWTNRAAHILGHGGTAGTVQLERANQ